ncbi:MAG: SAM-dependent methyltransferase [bacterium]|jgi:SAM-dependent methyltransferase
MAPCPGTRRKAPAAIAAATACAGMLWLAPSPVPVGRALAQPVEAAPVAGAPYVPTPWPVVRAMLELARVGDTDFVVDLGSGDGRVVIEAARSRGARGLGVEIEPDLVRSSNDEARQLGLSARVAFERRDLFETDLSQATVVTLYLLPRLLMELQPRLARLRPGTRIVSHDFRLGDWKPDATIKVDVPDRAFGPPFSTVYLWVVPAYVQGAWEGSVAERGRSERFRAELRQDYQSLSGTLRVGARSGPLDRAAIAGDKVTFGARIDGPGGPVRHSFDGRSVAGELVGQWTVEAAGRPTGPSAAAAAPAFATTVAITARRAEPLAVPARRP